MSDELPSAAQVRAYMEHWRDKLAVIAFGGVCSLTLEANNFGKPGGPATFRFYIANAEHCSREFTSPQAALAEAEARMTPQARELRLAEIKLQMQTLTAHLEKLGRGAA